MGPKKKGGGKKKLSEEDLEALKSLNAATKAGSEGEAFGKNLFGRRAGGMVMGKEVTSVEPEVLVPVYQGSAQNQSLRPSCLDDVMRRVLKKETLVRAAPPEEIKREVNKRFANGLFMPRIDVEAVGAVLKPVDLGAILKAQDEMEDAARGGVSKEEHRKMFIAQAEAAKFVSWKNLTLNETGDVYKPPPVHPLKSNHTKLKLKPTSFPSSSSSMSFTQHTGPSLDEESTLVTLPSLRASRRHGGSALHPPGSAEGSVDSSQTQQTLSLGEAVKYFGPQARGDFFEQYRVMARQSMTFCDAQMTHVAAKTYETSSGRSWMSLEEAEAVEKSTNAAAATAARVLLSSPSDKPDGKREPFSFTLNEMGQVIVVPVIKKKKQEQEGEQPPEGLEREGQSQDGSTQSPLKEEQRTVATGRRGAASAPSIRPQSRGLPANEPSSWSVDVHAFRTVLTSLDQNLLEGPDHQYFISGGGGSVSSQLHRSLDFETNRREKGSAVNDMSQVSLSATLGRGRDSASASVSGAGTGTRSSDIGSPRSMAVRARLQELGLTADSQQQLFESRSLLNAGPSTLSMSTSMSMLHSQSLDGAESLRSPRTAYIAACIDHKVAPLPKVIVRKALSTVVDLSHYRMGDVLGSALADGIAALPSIESINLRDNNLTDKSLHPLLLSLRRIRGVLELDLSQNKIDEQASEALAALLSDPSCQLEKLTLENSDVDDVECCKFVECLQSNSSLKTLDLSNNELGSHENDREVQTGGKAIGDFLNHRMCRLHTLSIKWNKIRGKSAHYLASSLAQNSTLTLLDLSYNGLGTAAGEVLGASLLENKTLQTLVIKNNNITSTACVSLCIGLGQALAMREIFLDENPVGEKGAKAIMNLPQIVGDRLKVSANACNTQLKDASCFFDPSNVVGNYSLDLSLPFHRAVAFSILQTVAAHSTCVIQRASLQPLREREGGSKSSKPSFGREEKLEFVQSVASDKEEYFDEEQRRVLAGLRLLEGAAADVTKATALFHEADLDNSGMLDRDELQLILARLGIGAANNPRKFADIMSLFDLDGSGLMSKSDFLSLVKSQRIEATNRIKEMVTYSVMALASRPGLKYMPPKGGLMELTVVDSFLQKKSYAVMTEATQKSTLQMARILGDASLLNAAIKNSKLHTQEAYDLFRSMFKETGKLLPSVAQILPQMESANEAKRLLSLVTNDDDRLVQQVKNFLGATVGKVASGLVNGYYLLDLSLEMHRTCLSKLLEASQEMNAVRSNKFGAIFGKAGVMGDTSQHGNWSCFRNEVLNHEPFIIAPETLTPMPQAGTLEFDFCSTAEMQGGEVALTNTRFCRVLANLSLLRTPEAMAQAVQCLEIWGREPKYYRPVVSGSSLTNRTDARRNDGFFSLHECDEERAVQIAMAKELFVALRLERKAQYREALQREKKGHIWVSKALGELHIWHKRKGGAGGPGSDFSPGAFATTALDSQSSWVEDLEEEVEEVVVGLEDSEVEGEADENLSLPDEADFGLQESSLLTNDTALGCPVGASSMVLAQSQRAEAIEKLRRNLEALLDLDPSIDERAPRSVVGSLAGTPTASAFSSPVVGSRKTMAVDGGGSSTRGGSNTASPAATSRKSILGPSRSPSSLNLAALNSPAAIAQLAANRAAAIATRCTTVTAYRAARFVDVVQEAFSCVWLRARHVALLLTLLPHVHEERTPDFGSYAVELCCVLYSRVLDKHNWDLVLRLLSPREAGILLARLGPLNLFCPCKPEGAVRLDLQQTDERRLFKLFLSLSTAENSSRSFRSLKYKAAAPEELAPPEPDADKNFGPDGERLYLPKARKTSSELREMVQASFQESDESALSAPPKEWSTVKGLPLKGVITLDFTGGALKGRGELDSGYRVNRLLRRALTHCTLCDESQCDVDDEDDDDLRAHLASQGRGLVDSVANKTIANNASAWADFLLV